MKTIETKQIQDQQIKEAIEKVLVWKNKFHFSFATMLFSFFLLGFYILTPYFGVTPTVVLSVVCLVFIQQSIRSYNYFKFHRVTFLSLKMLHKIVDDMK